MLTTTIHCLPAHDSYEADDYCEIIETALSLNLEGEIYGEVEIDNTDDSEWPKLARVTGRALGQPYVADAIRERVEGGRRIVRFMAEPNV